MPACARGFLIFIDVITFLLGLAVLAVAIYALVDYREFSDFFNINTVYISLGVGIALVLISCVGCQASRRGQKPLLCFYLLIVTAALGAQIAAAVLISDWANDFKKQNDRVSGAIEDKNEIRANNAILSTYTACCTGCPPETVVSNVTSPVVPCNNALEYFNQTGTLCSNSQHELVCNMAQICASIDDGACYNTNGETNFLYPPVQVAQPLCESLKSFKDKNGVPLVGASSTGACGGGSPEVYMERVVDYLSNPLGYLVIGFGVLCGLQALNLIAAVVVLMCSRDEELRKR